MISPQNESIKLTIDEELRTLLPPLKPEELEELHESILKEGVRHSLVAWGEILVDGHHRYDFCEENQIPYQVEQIEFADREEAKIWILKHQGGRRNLIPYERAMLSMRLKDLLADKAKERQRGGRGGVLLPPTLAEAKETRDQIANIAGVSHGTISKVEYINKYGDEETKARLRRGEKGTSINKEYNRIRELRGESTKRRGAKKSDEKSTEIPPEDATFEGSPVQLEPLEPITVYENDLGVISTFPPGSDEEVRYCPKTQLKPIPRNRPDILVANLFTHFPEEFVLGTAWEIFKGFYERGGPEKTLPILAKIHELYGEFPFSAQTEESPACEVAG